MQCGAHLVPAPSILDLYVYNVQTFTFPLYRDALTVSIIASASYGLPYLPANAQSDAVPGVGAFALSAATLFTYQGARCAGCEPLTFIAFSLSPFYIYYYSCCFRKNQLFFAFLLLVLVLKNVYTFYLFYHLV